MKKNLNIAIPFLISCLAVFPLSAGQLLNPSLKPDENGQLSGWKLWNSKHPYRIRNGAVSTKTVTPDNPGFGLHQTVKYKKADVTPIIFGGWSTAEAVAAGGDYCVYLDVIHTDGSLKCVKANWTPGTHGWKETCSVYIPRKPVASVKFHVLLRHTSGKAMFKGMFLKRGEPGALIQDVSALSMAPWDKNRYCVRYSFFSPKIKSRCRLLDGKGRTVAEFEASGQVVRREINCGSTPVSVEITATDGISEKICRRELLPISVPDSFAGGRKVAIWTADSMEKISPLTFPTENASETLFLELAGNERESMQVLISNAQDTSLNQLSLDISPLKRADGTLFPGKIKWERVGYIPRTVPSGRHPEQLPEQEYWLPDPLLPPASFSVPPKATQGIWLTVHAPRGIPAGKYSGRIRVMSGAEAVGSIPFTVRAFAFSLPDTFSYRSAFSLMDGYLRFYYPRRFQEIRRKAWDIMLDHRLNPDDITRTEMPPVDDLLYARGRGMNSFNILHLVPRPRKAVLWTLHAPLKAYDDSLFEEFRRRLEPYMKELRKHGLDKYAYFYGFDELKKESYPVIARTREFVARQYGIPLMTTAYLYTDLKRNPEKKELKAADWFCPLTSVYDSAFSERLRKENHQVWWYTCCAPEYPYMNFANLEYPFYEGRLIAWQTFFQKADGFLFWHVNNWLKTERLYLDAAQTYQPAYHRLKYAMGATGDGEFLYPGRQEPYPSIRLANLRDGSEDYDYLAMLAETDPETARKTAERLTPRLRSFERNPVKIREARRQLATELENRCRKKQSPLP